MQRFITINAGSSSIKASIFSCASEEGILDKVADATVTGLGQPKAVLRIKQSAGDETSRHIAGADPRAAAASLLDGLAEQTDNAAVTGIGHRIVHGGPHNARSVLITDQLERELETLKPYDPEHAPMALWLIAEIKHRFPSTPQVACFDTAFFHDMPRVARLLPLPRSYQAKGLRRYGFHGLSYSYLLQALKEAHGPGIANGKVIMAHLGSGASLAALKDGKPVDTTMSFTPASGLPMSTRSGDLDPGIAWYLQNQAGVDAEAFNRMVNFESGLLGVSGLSGDMYTLLQHEASDTHAREAIDLFCYQVKKSIGALAATLNGLDALVFSGGIGEQSALLRSRICDGLDYLGIVIDGHKNEGRESKTSAQDSNVSVFVIPTDENRVVAEETRHTVAQSAPKE